MKINLIFRQLFIAPVQGSIMEHAHRIIEVDVPDFLKYHKFELIGGAYAEPKRVCRECNYHSKSGCLCGAECNDHNSQWKPKPFTPPKETP